MPCFATSIQTVSLNLLDFYVILHKTKNTMKAIISLFRKWYYRRLFFRIYNICISKQDFHPVNAVECAAEAIDEIRAYFSEQDAMDCVAKSSHEKKDKPEE